MNIDRRQFLAAGLAAASSATQSGCGEESSATGEPADFAAVRADFPRALNEIYFNSAAQHPVGVHTAQGMQRYTEFMSKGPGEGRVDFWETGYREVKPMFARLINAKPSEIAFCASTTVGENLIVNGMDLAGGNVVTNDLHYTSCLYNYEMRRRAGLDVRLVKHRDWRIDLPDMEKAVDNKTKLIAISLVSSVNGHLENVKALSELAHAHGAYLFADIIQAAGAVPIDVKAMGIDFASCAMYKWLQGEHGSGFLYVREGLEGTVVKPTQLSGGVQFNYAPWVGNPKPGEPEIITSPRSGAAMLECGTLSAITYAGQYESFKYIEKLGVGKIRAHARALTNRLQKELPALGYTSITPPGTESPIVTFLSQDTEATKAKIARAAETGKAKISITGPNSALTVGRFGNHMRISVSVFNNDEDVDGLLDVLS